MSSGSTHGHPNGRMWLGRWTTRIRPEPAVAGGGLQGIRRQFVSPGQVRAESRIDSREVSTRNRTAHLGLYDTLADWEVGHLIAELRSGRFTGVQFDIVAVAESREPITTMGGVRILPDALIAELDPADSDVLILPGAEMWDAGGGAPFADAARRFLESGVPVAAICGATAGLARAGLLDECNHTSGAPCRDGVPRRRPLHRRAGGRRRRPHHRRPTVPCAICLRGIAAARPGVGTHARRLRAPVRPG